MPRARERYEAIRKEMLEEKNKQEQTFTHNVYDVIKNEEGKFEVVKVMYNINTGSAKMEKMNLVFDTPGKADYNSNSRNVAERIERLKTGKG
jgi:hypothetical protein